VYSSFTEAIHREMMMGWNGKIRVSLAKSNLVQVVSHCQNLRLSRDDAWLCHSSSTMALVLQPMHRVCDSLVKIHDSPNRDGMIVVYSPLMILTSIA